MDARTLFDTDRRNRAPIVLVLCLMVLVAATMIGWLVQRDMGRVEVSNVTFQNSNGISVRAKLLRPVEATADHPMPGAVYIHGYQNNRETSDAFCIELARRGFVVLNIDAIGRGNSGIPGDPEAADFDDTYGGRSSLAHLRSLPYVDQDRVAMMGHSLGAEMAYNVALGDPGVRALVISGFAYNLDASTTNPKNMLMIIGQYDEYRERMTGVDDIEAEWMDSPQTRQVIAAENPQLGVTYGDFAEGTARRVFVPRTIHIQESHSGDAIAEAVTWMRAALHPDDTLWVDPASQTWPIKEWATLLAMLAGMASLLPLGLILLRTPFFASLQGEPGKKYVCDRPSFIRHALLNGLLMWLYLPLILALFGLHVYLVPIDKLFPMMMVNGTVWWFVAINLIGLLMMRRWYRRHYLSLKDLGISYQEGRFKADWGALGRTALLAAALFLFAYLIEASLERLFIVDYRFIFPFASDLTPYRALMFLIYFPILLIGFVPLGLFLHGQLRLAQRSSWLRTFFTWSAANTLALVVPLALFMLVQYVPLLTSGTILLVGPGGMLASFTMNLFHIMGVLIMIVPVSTWCYQLTGKVYLGAILSAALVAWMFTSSQVIAPIPV